MLLALTGFMGSGKTSVGRAVADSLGCPFLDLDEIIEKNEGRNIPEIFASDGESGFRALEMKALRKVLSGYGTSTAVLALGGGTVTIAGAAALLQEKTLCIYLKASPEALAAHLEGKTGHRPLLNGEELLESIRERLSAREELYNAAAHIVLDTDGLSPDEIAGEIIIDCL